MYTMKFFVDQQFFNTSPSVEKKKSHKKVLSAFIKQIKELKIIFDNRRGDELIDCFN